MSVRHERPLRLILSVPPNAVASAAGTFLTHAQLYASLPGQRPGSACRLQAVIRPLPTEISESHPRTDRYRGRSDATMSERCPGCRGMARLSIGRPGAGIVCGSHAAGLRGSRAAPE